MKTWCETKLRYFGKMLSTARVAICKTSAYFHFNNIPNLGTKQIKLEDDKK